VLEKDDKVILKEIEYRSRSITKH